MKSINIYYIESDQDELVAHSYHIDKLDITPEKGSYIEFIEHYPGGNPNHDMYKEATRIIYLYPEEDMCIKIGEPAFYDRDDHNYYKLPKECYSVYNGKEQQPKTMRQLDKEDTQ